MFERDAMAEESQRFQTQNTEDDFCEVIVQPRKEPVIEDKPPDQASHATIPNQQHPAPVSKEPSSEDNGEVPENENGRIS